MRDPTGYVDASVPAGTRIGPQVVREGGANRSNVVPVQGPSEVRGTWRP